MFVWYQIFLPNTIRVSITRISHYLIEIWHSFLLTMEKPPYLVRKKWPYYQYGALCIDPNNISSVHRLKLVPWHTHQISICDWL